MLDEKENNYNSQVCVQQKKNQQNKISAITRTKLKVIEKYFVIT